MTPKRRHKSPVPDKVRIDQLKAERKKLTANLEAANREIRELRNRADLVVAIAGADNAEAVRIVSEYLETLHTVSLLADANQAIRYDTPRVSGGGARPAHNPVPAWAANRLDTEIDDLHSRTESLRGFVHSPRETLPLSRARRAHRCNSCGQDLK